MALAVVTGPGSAIYVTDRVLASVEYRVSAAPLDDVELERLSRPVPVLAIQPIV